jgi:lipoprotein signal peptidase
MFTALPSSISHPPVARRVAVLTLAVMTADQVARALALGAAEGNPSAVLSARTTSLGLGAFDPPLPMVALLAAIGIVAVGLVGLRRAQAGLLPAWVPGFLVGGAASTVLDRFAGGAVADLLPAPWSVCTVADLAIVAGIVGWILADRTHGRDRGPQGIRA